VSTPPATKAPPRRVDGSMSLLNDMMANTLDEAYAERAARKAGEQGDPAASALRPASTAARRASTVVLLLALGTITGTAVAQVRERQQAGTGLRAELAAEVRDRTARTDELAAAAQRLRAQVAAAQAELLGADAQGRLVSERLVDLGLASATLPVEGPGLRVTLDDAKADSTGTDGGLRGGSLSDRRVQDRDLQGLVNALWAAGAEAISIDGERLTALTAIRSAGETILVDFSPLSPPYVVEAVGDPARLEVELLDGAVGRALTTYQSVHGLTFEVRREDELSLPGAGTPDLRAARTDSTVDEEAR
jgi:uncharacterized protein YlxW (UPF0749 family)